MLNSEGVVNFYKNLLGRNVESKIKEYDNGSIIKVFPWDTLQKPWNKMHIEATPEKKIGEGYSVHFDFYRLNPKDMTSYDESARQDFLDYLISIMPATKEIINEPFNIDPRKKMHFLVEQVDVIPYDTSNIEKRIANLMYQYTLAFDLAVRASANSL
ncbi:MAG: hypothetical protein ACYC27_21935 [Armatimonadota bacterium]